MTTIKNPFYGLIEGRMDILNGPGKWDLMIGLFESKIENPHLVTFTIGLPTDTTEPKHSALALTEILVNIMGIDRSGDEGDFWYIKGYNPENRQSFLIEYNSQTRKGVLR